MPVPQTLSELRSVVVEDQNRLTTRQRGAAYHLIKHPHNNGAQHSGNNGQAVKDSPLSFYSLNAGVRFHRPQE